MEAMHKPSGKRGWMARVAMAAVWLMAAPAVALAQDGRIVLGRWAGPQRAD